MKKLRLLIPSVATTIVATLTPTIVLTSCSCSKQIVGSFSIELSNQVADQGISIKSANLSQGKDSTIVLNLPEDKTISSISIKIGDNTITNPDITISGNVITIAGSKITMTDVIVSSITLKGETQVDFCTCDWPEIDKWCQKLENEEIDETKFCKHFLIGTEPVTSLDQFIGLERTIKINNINHTIRIIGTLQDTISVEGTLNNKKAVFSFELVSLLSDSTGNMIQTLWNQDPNNFDFLNSNLRANLNGSGLGTTTWSTSALDMLNDSTSGTVDLYQAIKPTIHYVITAESWSAGYKTESQYCDKLFILSYYNTTSTKNQYCKETQNSIYQYYANKELSGQAAANDSRVKMDVNGNANWYWASSPYTKFSNESWIVKDDGQLSSNAVNDTTGGLSFAFCI